MQHSQITDALADKFKSNLETPLIAIKAGIIVAMSLGGLLILIAVAICIVVQVRKKVREKIVSL